MVPGTRSTRSRLVTVVPMVTDLTLVFSSLSWFSSAWFASRASVTICLNLPSSFISFCFCHKTQCPHLKQNVLIYTNQQKSINNSNFVNVIILFYITNCKTKGYITVGRALILVLLTVVSSSCVKF